MRKKRKLNLGVRSHTPLYSKKYYAVSRKQVALKIARYVSRNRTRSCSEPGCESLRYSHYRYCSRHYYQKTTLRNKMIRVYQSIKDRAKRRKIPFNISFSEFELFCQKTGYYERRGTHKNDLSIDRMDNNTGYCLSNMQTLTVSDNARKGRLSMAAFERKKLQLRRRRS